MKILIAEDDPNTGQFLKIVLNKVGYDTILATNGNQAWEILQQEDSPKLAIFDWMMPGLSGVELCKKLRATDEHIRTYIILLTAKSEMNDVIIGLKTGADDYITKPFKSIELIARLKIGERSLELQSQLIQRIQNLEEVVRRNQLLGQALRNQRKPKTRSLPNNCGMDHILMKTLNEMGVKSLKVRNETTVDNELKPHYVAWTSLYQVQDSISIDLKIEISEASAKALYTKIVKDAELSEEKILDIMIEILNMTMANYKTVLNANGIQILTPFIPKAMTVVKFPANSYEKESAKEFYFEGQDISFKLEVIEQSTPVEQKSLNELRSLEVVAEPVYWPGNKARIILNTGILLNEYYILKLRDVLHLQDLEFRVSVYQPSKLSRSVHSSNNQLVETN
ncbi:MAG: response regulator [Bacteroidetes bacterium]|nr:response regulator [Bacteroidota bacterium]